MRTLSRASTMFLLLASAGVAIAADDVALSRAADLSAPVRLSAGGLPILAEGGFAAPFMGDFDGDGKKDLLVGQWHAGRLRIYRNVGGGGAPELGKGEDFVADGGWACVPWG
jgi:hypothetical protein